MIIYMGFMLRRNIWSAFQTCIALLTVSFKSTTSLERLVVKVQKITFMFQSKKLSNTDTKKNTSLPLLLSGTLVLQWFSSSGIDRAP